MVSPVPPSDSPPTVSLNNITTNTAHSIATPQTKFTLTTTRSDHMRNVTPDCSTKNCIYAAFSIELRNPPILTSWEDWLPQFNEYDNSRGRKARQACLLVRVCKMFIELDGKMCSVISKIHNGYYPVSYSQRPTHTNIKALTAGY